MSALDWIWSVLREWNAAAMDEVDHFRSIDGFAAFLGEYALLFPAGMCVIWIVFGLMYVLRKESRLVWSNQASRELTIVVPARNEESGIRRTLESLLAQNYPLMRILVISDASTDRTVEVARQYARRGVAVHQLHTRHGKAGALQYALDRTETELFMVIDADTVCGPGAIWAMVQQFAKPQIAGVTGSPRVAHANDPLTWMQAMEYIGIIGLIKRADSFWGGLFTVSGAAACFRTDVLREVGGWSGRSVTEDIELSWRMQKAGYELAFEPRATFSVQAPSHLPALYRQRRRWARGMWEVLRLHGNLACTRNTVLIPMAAQVVGTVLWMALALGTVVLWMLRTSLGFEIGTAIDPETAIRMLAATTSLFVTQTVLACLWETHYRSGLWRYVPMAVLYPLYYWLVIAPTFVLGVSSALATRRTAEAKWERTERTVAASDRRAAA